MASQLEALVSRVAELDAKLASDITLQLKHAARDKEFGLVFNRHMPEMVELYGRSVRRGDKVRVVGEQQLYVVARARGRGADRIGELVSAAAEPREVPMSELVVVADFDDPIYPGLRSTGRVERGGDKPFHAVINAENFHALRALQFSHREKVDCIYIDPPYNTGGDLTYNDKRVAREDANRHSKWLSFMERRLKLAKELLKDTGVIIVAIDDNEHAYLKLLMDKVFGESNFIANLVWDSPSTNSGKTTAGGVDYMLVYTKDSAAHFAELRGGKWAESRSGRQEMLGIVERSRADGDTPQVAEKRLREWVSRAKKTGAIAPGTAMYSRVDDQWRVFRTGDLTGPSDRPNLTYPITDPSTGKVYPPPAGSRTAWAWSRAKMQAAIDAGDVYFGGGEVPSMKRYLADYEDTSPRSVFEIPRARGSKELETVFNERRFDFPKDTNVLARWIGIVTGNNPRAVILDFFGGSGSTMHAVMNMNAADGGRRQCVLVTNNEVNAAAEKALTKEGHRKGDPEWERHGIHQRVTRPRIETVVTGVREDGSHYSDGLSENVEFFDLTYEDAERVGLGHAYEAVSPLLWMRAGATGERIDIAEGFAVTDTYAVLFNPDRWKPFTTALRGKDIRCVYVVTDTDAVFNSVKEHLPVGADTVRLYEDFLSTFKFTTGS